MLLQDPSQVDGAHKSTITKKCSYKTRARSTEHTRVLLQRNALTRPEPGRRSTQEYYYKEMLLQDPSQVDRAHKRVLLLTKYFEKPTFNYVPCKCACISLLLWYISLSPLPAKTRFVFNKCSLYSWSFNTVRKVVVSLSGVLILKTCDTYKLMLFTLAFTLLNNGTFVMRMRTWRITSCDCVLC